MRHRTVADQGADQGAGQEAGQGAGLDQIALTSKAPYRTILDRLRDGLRVLPDKPDETPEATLACLWATAARGEVEGGATPDIIALPPLDVGGLARLEALVVRRLGGEPLAYLTGCQTFMGLTFRTTRAALIPRRETEVLARAALDRLRRADRLAPRLVDLCTGCGNIALALAALAPHARVWGSDLSAEAVALARENADHLGRPDVTFVEGDLAAPFDTPEFRGRVDVVTCNPPYISSARLPDLPPEIQAHEPRLAFDGGPFGVSLVQRLIQDAPTLLRPGGWLVMEVGAGQGPALVRRLERNAAFDTVDPLTDAAGEIRAVAARKSART